MNRDFDEISISGTDLPLRAIFLQVSYIHDVHGEVADLHPSASCQLHFGHTVELRDCNPSLMHADLMHSFQLKI